MPLTAMACWTVKLVASVIEETGAFGLGEQVLQHFLLHHLKHFNSVILSLKAF